MSCKVINNSGMDMSSLTSMAKRFYPYAQKYLGFDKPATIVYESDPANAQNPLGNTAHYEPQNYKITLYVDGRHPKDLLRSLAHELVHHTQNCRGDLTPDKMGETGPGYAQSNKYMRGMEREAYEKGNLCMRDWEDQLKQNNNTLQEQKQMSDFNQNVAKILMEKIQAELRKETEGHSQVVNENGEQIWAPNHYCVHHGGVQHNGQIEMAEAVKHNFNEEEGRVTHYDMKLTDGTILENVAAEDILVTQASLAEWTDEEGQLHEHGDPKRNDDEEGSEESEEEKQEEGKMPMVKKDGKMVPAFAADGEGDDDLGKADGDEGDSDEEDKVEESVEESDPESLEEVFAGRNGQLLERLIKDWATK